MAQMGVGVAEHGSAASIPLSVVDDDATAEGVIGSVALEDSDLGLRLLRLGKVARNRLPGPPPMHATFMVGHGNGVLTPEPAPAAPGHARSLAQTSSASGHRAESTAASARSR